MYWGCQVRFWSWLLGPGPPLWRRLHFFGSHPIGPEAMGGTGIRNCARLQNKKERVVSWKELMIHLVQMSQNSKGYGGGGW